MDASHWVKHEATIRRLYVTERRSLREVKRIMEKDHGFPGAKLSTWETTLRENLGMFKRLKKEHWRLLYEQYMDRGKKKFDLYANGFLVYPWGKVWKELRRRRKMTLQQDMSLPPGLSLRTPRLGQIPFPQLLASNGEPVAMGAVTVTDVSICVADFGSPTVPSDDGLVMSSGNSPAVSSDDGPAVLSDDGPVITAGPFDLPIRVRTEQMPWNMNRLECLASIVGADEVYNKYEIDDRIRYALMPKDGFLEHAPGRLIEGRLLARIADTRFPGHHADELRSQSFSGLSPDFNAYHILSILVYLASNNLVPIDERDSYLPQWPELLDMLVNKISRRLLVLIFSSNYLSIRATWENAFDKADRLNQTEAVVLLIEMVLDRHFDWILPIMDAKVLFAAARSGTFSLVQKLINKGARPRLVGFGTGGAAFETAVVAAVKREAWDCVSLLLENSEIRGELSPDLLPAMTLGPDSHFRALFLYIEARLSKSWMVNPDDGVAYVSLHKRAEAQSHCIEALRLFLRVGADVDIPFFCPRPHSYSFSALETFHTKVTTPLEWLPTCLDMSLYWDERIFKYLQYQSRDYRSATKATRAGIIKALLDGGNDALDQYLRAKSRPPQEFFELLLVEQFFMQLKRSPDWWEKVDVRLARLLIEYGIGINSRVTKECGGVSFLLQQVVATMGKVKMDDDMHFILVHLLRNGAIICENTLRIAVQKQGIGILEILSTFGADIRQEGKLALLNAVSLNNHQAVKWLLNKGVDINSEFQAKDSRLTLLGALISRWDLVAGPYPLEPRWHDLESASSRLPIIRFLLTNGTHLKLQVSDPSPYRFLFDPRTRSLASELVELMIDFPAEMAKISDQEWQTLYSVWAAAILRNKRVFQTFKLRHRGFNHGFVLADAILMTDSRQKLGRQLESTMEGNIVKFVEDSSDLDLYSGWSRMMTPLQAAASICDTKLVETLLLLGADINAPAQQTLDDSGCTALEAACEYRPRSAAEAQRRDSLIRYLVRSGADLYARCNSSESDERPLLNLLASRGDLEAVALLLEYGVDPNRVLWTTYKGRFCGRSALDVSASNGRLDVTHLLLKCGGLSADPGKTGYFGAVKRPTKSTIVELVRKHEKQLEDEFAQYPELGQKHREMIDQQVRRGAEAMQRLEAIKEQNQPGINH